jgi:enoyl-CoA hydratase
VFTSPVLTLERDGPVATLWLDAPDRRNAMGPEFWDDLPRAMDAVADADDVRAVLILGRGRDFSIGLDLKALPNLRGPADTSPAAARGQVFRTLRRLQAAITSVADCPVPVIAVVHGYCLGGGVDLVTACDIRLAVEGAVFSVRETRMAMVADVGTLQRLPRVLAAGHVAELVFTGRDVDAARAREIGLVNDVYGDVETGWAAGRALAEEIAGNSPLAVRGAKAVLRAGETLTTAQGLEHVALWNTAFIDSDDLGEAMAAFLAKRPPRFTGRRARPARASDASPPPPTRWRERPGPRRRTGRQRPLRRPNRRLRRPPRRRSASNSARTCGPTVLMISSASSSSSAAPLPRPGGSSGWTSWASEPQFQPASTSRRL